MPTRDNPDCPDTTALNSLAGRSSLVGALALELLRVVQ